MKKASIILSLLVITCFAACSKKSNAGKSKVKYTTYTTDVMPLIQAKCTPCHLPSAGGNKANFEGYETAKKFSAEMLDRIVLQPGQRGFMPMKHEKLAEAEIAVFKKWVNDGLLEK